MQAEIGLIGLGVMGANLALNIAEHGFPIAVFNRTTSVTDEFVANAGPLRDKIIACHTLEEFVAAIKPPRPMILLVKAGEAVDQQIEALKKLIAPRDIIIDAGNTLFTDTVRREKALAAAGFDFIGLGVSGGEEGARHGPSIMVGGPEASYHRVEKVLTAISAKFKGEACCDWMGPDGAGHFVKMIHNGIEYADMEMIAEIYGIMRDHLKMKPAAMAKTFAAWNKGKLDSYLIEITAKVLAMTDKKTKKPIVDVIKDSAGQKGTGKWSVIAAQELGVPVAAMEAAVAARVISSMLDERKAAAKVFKSAKGKVSARSRSAALKQLEAALYAAKICAYAQGLAVLEKASATYGWNLQLGKAAKIWRAGCIIRSRFLDLITQAYAKRSGNLLMAPAFSKAMRANVGGLRRVVADAALLGLPAPALSSALAYFDAYRQQRGTANMIQGQRDFFGRHSFERLDMEGTFHLDSFG